MKVEIIAHTPEPLKVVYTAARACYSTSGPQAIFETEIAEDRMVELVRKVIERGHTSILEHVSFTFAVEGISRSCSHQLVRHRIASYSQQSQRRCSFEKGSEYVTPPSIASDPEALEIFQDNISLLHKAYKTLLELEIPSEDARFLLPNAATTNIVVSMNARELHHFFRLRCCYRAQWEIRGLAWKMLEEVREIVAPLFEKAGPACVSEECKEDWPECPMLRQKL